MLSLNSGRAGVVRLAALTLAVRPVDTDGCRESFRYLGTHDLHLARVNIIAAATHQNRGCRMRSSKAI